MTELTDPQNSSDAGRYVELHNNGDDAVDLSAGWALVRWTNGNADPQTPKPLTGTIDAGGFYIICNDADKFSTTYGGTCDQDIGTGGPADSNGDDNVALLGVDGGIVDMFGVAGEDGTGTGHEFEDGRAERAEGNATASATWDEAGWNIDNDSGGGDGNQYAPEGFDPGEWIGADVGGDDGGSASCDDDSACNTGADADCEYADDGFDCDGNHVVYAGNMYFSPSDLSIDVGATVVWINEGGTHDVVVESGPELFGFADCVGPCEIGSHTFTLAGYYEYICSIGNHAASGMTGTVTVGTGGCTDDTASNYNADADFDDDSCTYPQPAANLFFSEHAEGSSSNKYFEVYNASDADVSLNDYVFVNCSNGCDDWEYTNSFAADAVIAAGDVYAVCHSSFAGDLSLCDETRTLYHNGDDAQGLMHMTDGLLDVFGAIGDDPGSGWEVAGVADATKDHTLIRKATVTSGNTDWASSAGTSSDDSEWIVLDQNTWDYLGSHPHDFSTAGCMDSEACNYDESATEDDGSCLYNDCLGECGGDAVVDDCGECQGDGTACLVSVTFSVDMNIEGVVGDIKLRTSTVNGEYNPSDWFVMDDSDGDLV